jgi:hypothetical protein
MNEPLFGSSAPSWTGTSVPAFGWIQPAAGIRPGGIGSSGFGALQSGQQGATGPITAVPTVAATYRPAWEPAAPLYAAQPQPYGFANGMTMAVQPGVMFGPAGQGPGPMVAPLGLYGAAGGFLPAVGQELPIGLAAPAILATVAMRRGQPMGPTTDQEVEEFIYDALELLPGTSEVDVRCEGGRATLTGSVQHKRLKHIVGEIAWAIPQISDVQNTVTIASRRRSRPASREAEAGPTPAGRKQA